MSLPLTRLFWVAKQEPKSKKKKNEKNDRLIRTFGMLGTETDFHPPAKKKKKKVRYWSDIDR